MQYWLQLFVFSAKGVKGINFVGVPNLQPFPFCVYINCINCLVTSMCLLFFKGGGKEGVTFGRGAVVK